MNYSSLMLVFLLGCTTIDLNNPPAQDFPKLYTTENLVSREEVAKNCGKYSFPGYIISGCAIYNLIANTCEIWVPKDASKEVIEHERLHCKGYDHTGDTTLHDAWEEVKQWLKDK